MNSELVCFMIKLLSPDLLSYHNVHIASWPHWPKTMFVYHLRLSQTDLPIRRQHRSRENRSWNLCPICNLCSKDLWWRLSIGEIAAFYFQLTSLYRTGYPLAFCSSSRSVFVNLVYSQLCGELTLINNESSSGFFASLNNIFAFNGFIDGSKWSTQVKNQSFDAAEWHCRRDSRPPIA